MSSQQAAQVHEAAWGFKIPSWNQKWPVQHESRQNHPQHTLILLKKCRWFSEWYPFPPGSCAVTERPVPHTRAMGWEGQRREKENQAFSTPKGQDIWIWDLISAQTEIDCESSGNAKFSRRLKQRTQIMNGESEEYVAGKDMEDQVIELQYSGWELNSCGTAQGWASPCRNSFQYKQDSQCAIWDTSKRAPQHHWLSTKPSTAPGAISTWLQLPFPTEGREQT